MKFKWGIIGTGKIAHRFASDLKLLPEVELVGVVSRNRESVLKFSEEFGTAPYFSIEDLLSSEVEIIYIATPHTSHKEHSLLAINAGKAVLCEKPVSINYSEAQSIIDHAKLKNVFFMEAMWTRFFPAIEEVIQLVNSGAIGKLTSIESSFGYKSNYDPASRVFNPELGGGSLLDVGVYSVSLARMIVNEYAADIESTAILCPTGVDESAQWKLAFHSGTNAIGRSSVKEILQNEAIITGSRGTIRIPKFWCPKDYYFNDEHREFEFPGLGFHFEASAVMSCLKNGVKEESRLSHQHSLDVMKIMDGIVKNFESGGTSRT